MKDINWAVLGTGVIANEMAVALKKNGKKFTQNLICLLYTSDAADD